MDCNLWLERILSHSSSLRERIDENPLSERIEHKTNPIATIKFWQNIVCPDDLEKFNLYIRNVITNEDCIEDLIRPFKYQQRPSWTQHLIGVYTILQENNTNIFNVLKEFSDEGVFFQNELPFLEVLCPFIIQSRYVLEKHDIYNRNIISDQAKQQLELEFVEQVLLLTSKSLYYDYGQYRRKRAGVSYSDYVLDMLSGRLNLFLLEYPVLSKLIAINISNYCSRVIEMLKRFENDRELIIEKLMLDLANGIDDLLVIETIETNLSDSHNGGRRVYQLNLNCKESIIYKPRSLEPEILFNKLLNLLNIQFDANLKLKTVLCIDRTNYGWMQYVDYRSCLLKEDYENYYIKIGMLLSLVFMLCGEDLHYENIIASGRDPVLIDLETLFHPNPNICSENSLWTESIISTGLLPNWVTIEGSKIAYDTSGLGAISNQETPNKNWVKYKLVKEQLILKGENHRLSLAKNAPFPLSIQGESPANYVYAIKKGFRLMYITLMDEVDASALIGAFSSSRFRFIPRSTSTYSKLFLSSLHPKYLTDGLVHSIKLDLLSKYLLDRLHEESVKQLRYKEIVALEIGDIPYFVLFADKQCPGFCMTSGSLRVKNRIQGLRASNLNLQLALIEASFRTQSTQRVKMSLVSKKESRSLKAYSLTEIETHVQEIAKQIVNFSFHRNDRQDLWIGYNSSGISNRYQLRPLGADIYSGRMGLAIFFAAIGRYRICRNLVEPIANTKPPLSCGLFDGIGSLIYGFALISHIANDSFYLRAAEHYAGMIDIVFIKSQSKYDVASGLAGLLLALIGLYKVNRDTSLLEVCKSIANTLIDKQVKTRNGYRSWRAPDGEFYNGIPHGASGVSMSLVELHRYCPNQSYLDCAREAYIFEQSLYDSDNYVWRVQEGKDTYQSSWCYGAPGIGIAKLLSIDLYNDNLKSEINQCCEALSVAEPLVMDHLCCGYMGLTEFYLQAGNYLNDPALSDEAINLATRLVDSSKAQGGYCLLPNISPTAIDPGFFQGLSGIGYQLLRLYHPSKLPSVLSFSIV